jgi:uncharacterized membrane protein
MYSKAMVAGHPVHPMLIAFPVAAYTGTLVGYAIYGANGQQFWLNFAIALNIAGVGTALLAALPGIADLAFGVPRGSAAKTVGLAHGGINVLAVALFAAAMGVYVTHWNGPATSAVTGIVLSAVGLACTIAAGALGWMLVQSYHVGVRLTPRQETDELSVQNARLLRMPHHRAA